jgi:predicted enzyme related to lactoylglutathione lyase
MQVSMTRKLNKLSAKMDTKKHPTIANGKVCYIEIPAVDVLLSAAFYKKVFGWLIRERSNGQIAFDDAINEVSGTWVVGRLPTTEAGILVYIMVDSVASTLKAIVTHGGKIVQEIGADAPEITARFSDPASNIFGLYQEPVKE